MMGFFDNDFYKELDKNLESKEDTFDEFNFNNNDDVKLDSKDYEKNMNLKVNKSNKEKYDNIMDNAAIKYDSYWDYSNPIIKLILIILLVIIAVGLIYYIVGWFMIL